MCLLIHAITTGLRTIEESCPSDTSTAVIMISRINYTHSNKLCTSSTSSCPFRIVQLYWCFTSLSDYRPALSLASFTADFSERLSTFTYSFQESCSLYPRCTPYFSVEHTVSPQSVISNTSSACSVEYTTRNLMRCRSYQSIATALLGNQRGNTVVMGDTVMQSECVGGSE